MQKEENNNQKSIIQKIQNQLNLILFFEIKQLYQHAFNNNNKPILNPTFLQLRGLNTRKKMGRVIYFRQTLPHRARLWMWLLKRSMSKNGTELILSKSSSNSLLLKSINGVKKKKKRHQSMRLVYLHPLQPTPLPLVLSTQTTHGPCIQSSAGSKPSAATREQPTQTHSHTSKQTWRTSIVVIV